MDLNSMTVAELKALRADIDKALADFDHNNRKSALAAVEDVLRGFGVTLAELVGFAPKGKSKAKSPAKYANPADPTQTWSGRGRKPGWIKAAEAAGRDLAELHL